MPSSALEKDLRRVFPFETMNTPKITLPDRLGYVLRNADFFVSPRDLAIYLDVGSMEAAYPGLESNLKSDLLHVALSQWGYWAKNKIPSEEWEKTLQALFDVGADLEVLCSQETGKTAAEQSFRNLGGDAMVGLMHSFVRHYAWSSADRRTNVIEARDTLEGFQCLISRAKFSGVKLGTISSLKRFEICFDADFMWPWCDPLCDITLLDPHTLSLCYDGDLSTWVIWNSTYEEYCGEFWNSLDHVELMIPGTWVD